MNLHQRAYERRIYRRNKGPRALTYEEKCNWVTSCLIEFHGINGIAIHGNFQLMKDLKLIVTAEVTPEGWYRITLYRSKKPHTMICESRDAFEDELVEGMSYHV